MTWVLPDTHLLKAATPTFCFTKSSFKFQDFIFLPVSPNLFPLPAAFHCDGKQFQQNPPLFSPNQIQKSRKKSPTHAINHKLRPKTTASFIEKLKQKNYLDPVNFLEENGDWSEEQFWDVIKFLRRSQRTNEIPQVFDLWKQREKPSINEGTYAKIIGSLFDEGLADAAASALAQMKTDGLKISPDTYDVVIQGFAKKGRFDDALFYLKEMKDTGMKPNCETYDGLIQAYGTYGMYNEMGGCLKEMKGIGSLPDHVTYNLLIREFAKAGLLQKMESTHQALVANRMELQSSTLISMLEAYAKFRILDKMERFTRRALKSKARIDDDLIRKVARVYIENLMFSRLEELGLGLSPHGSSDLAWCLRMLSHACVCSRKGMYSIIHEMESNKVPWNVTIVNIISLSYLKMKDYAHLNVLLSELPLSWVKPDIVTVGILFDACDSGFDGTRVKNTWRRNGYFKEKVGMQTDPLVLNAFGKGQFFMDFEKIYSVDSEAKNTGWNYHRLIKVMDVQKRTTAAEKVEIKSS